MDAKDVLCRDVVRAEGFDDAAVSIFGTIQAADEALAGLEFTAARHPEQGQVAGEHDSVVKVYLLKTHASAIGPAVGVYYIFNHEKVTFLFVERAEVEDMDV